MNAIQICIRINTLLLVYSNGQLKYKSSIDPWPITIKLLICSTFISSWTRHAPRQLYLKNSNKNALSLISWVSTKTMLYSDFAMLSKQRKEWNDNLAGYLFFARNLYDSIPVPINHILIQLTGGTWFVIWLTELAKNIWYELTHACLVSLWRRLMCVNVTCCNREPNSSERQLPKRVGCQQGSDGCVELLTLYVCPLPAY